VFCVLLSVWIGCTEVRYCALCGVVCVDWLHWGKVLCVRWFCVCGEVVLKLGTVCWVVLFVWFGCTGVRTMCCAVLCVWIGFTEVRYFVLIAIMCKDWFHCIRYFVLSGVLCVDWFYRVKILFVG